MISMNNKEVKLVLSGLTCANCANKIETRVNNLEGVKEANLNFTTSTLTIEGNEDSELKDIVIKAKEIINKLEPEVKVYNKDEENVVIENMNRCTSGVCSTVENDSHNSYENNGHTSHEEHSHNHDHSHGHSHNHSHDEPITLKENLRLIIGAIIFVIAMFLDKESVIAIGLFVVSYLLIGGKVILTAFKNIARGEVFDENFLMTIATLGAFFIGEYPEGVAVMLFYEIGELFQSYAVNKSRKSITSLMKIRADYANVIRNGNEEKVNPETVNIDEVILVKPGERVPLDGVITEGNSFVDTSALTGESVPREVSAGEEGGGQGGGDRKLLPPGPDHQ